MFVTKIFGFYPKKSKLKILLRNLFHVERKFSGNCLFRKLPVLAKIPPGQGLSQDFRNACPKQ